MTESQLVEYVKNDLTGGGVIDIDVTDTVIQSYIRDGLERVRDWYREWPVVETVGVHFSSATAGFIPFSELEKPVHIVETVLPIEMHTAGDFVLEEISDLLGLPAGLFTSTSVREYAMWMPVREMIRKSMGKELSWREIGDVLFLDAVPNSQTSVSVIYVPLPLTIEDVTYGPAITWVKDWTRAKTLVAWGGVLTKFTDGALGFSTNGASLRDEGNSIIANLEETKKRLQFSYMRITR
jgi:hypothetical protein